MKITQVEAIHLRLPVVNERCDGSQDTLVVKVHTDAGISGVGPEVILIVVRRPYAPRRTL